jgi:molybdate transport system substrate-binding protein
MRKGALAAGKIAFVILLSQGAVAFAAEIKVLSPAGFRPVLSELGPQFERSTGHKLVIQYGSAAGMKRQIEAGEAFDLAVLTTIFMDDVGKQGKIAAGTRTDVARSAMGVVIRAGAAKPDIGSVDALKRTLLAAKSVTYSPEGTIGIHLARVLDRLGIADELKAKIKPAETPDAAIRGVANGEAELGFGVTSLILSTPGAELLGQLPAELQGYVVYAAAIGPAAKEGEAAKALVAFLKSDGAAPVIKAKGMEPLGR